MGILKSMKILIADDHALFCDTLSEYLQRFLPDAGYEIVGDFDSAFALIQEHEFDFDLVLLDFLMPGMNGLEGLRSVRENFPHVKVAMMSGVAQPHHVEDALALGAIGYFPKTLSGTEFVEAIQQVVSGQSFVPIDFDTGSYVPSYNVGGANLGGSSHDVKADLTPREREVLSFLVKGDANKDIADALGLQVVTIKLHVRSICQKLGVKNRTQAALKAREIGVF